MLIDENSNYSASAPCDLWHKFIEHSPQGMIVTNQDLVIITINDSYSNLSGFTDEVIGQHVRTLSSGWNDKYFYQEMWRLIEQNGYWQGEIRNRKKDGTSYLCELSISLISGEGGEYYLGTFSDMTEKRGIEIALHKMANFDALTGVSNRHSANQYFSEIIDRSKFESLNFSVFFIDLDRFKPINDSLGHETGDVLLKAVAGRLCEITRENDLVARIGGDEFIIIIEGLSRDQTYRKADEISKVLSKVYYISEHEIFISACTGVSIYPDDGTSMDMLISKADTAMYKVKESGKNGFSFFSDNMQRDTIAKYEIECELRRAIERKELYLNYQPQINLQTGDIIGVEALLRWNSQKLGFVSPIDFIPIAEETDLINEIGEWVLKEACEQRKRWETVVSPSFKLAINLSAKQLYIDDISQHVLSLTRLSGIPESSIAIEITESILMVDPEMAANILTEFRKMNFSIAIDDFGTGYSSLSYLREFKIDKLKIDKSFVDMIPKDQDSSAIIYAIITMGTKMGLTVIAEGVETLEQVKVIKDYGCQEAQGYFFYKPMSAGKFTEMYIKTKGIVDFPDFIRQSVIPKSMLPQI